MKVSRRWASLIVLGSLAVFLMTGLVGCGEEEVVDPYQYASLNAIMSGALKDTTHTFHETEDGEKVEYGKFAFEIDAPPFEYVRGPVGMVRDGNQLHFLVGQDLENIYPSLQGALLGVKMTFTPQPTHLVLERIKRDGVVERDSIPRPQDYTLPRLLRAGAVDITEPGRDLTDADWQRRETLQVLMPENEDDPPLRFQTGIDSLVWVPKHDLPDSVKASPTPEDMAFYAVMPTGSFQIVELAPGADYMLHLLIDENLPLVGSVSPLSWVEDWQLRKQEHENVGHVVGELRLNWFKYANAFVQGYRPEF
jgi:hypothetical protein